MSNVLADMKNTFSKWDSIIWNIMFMLKPFGCCIIALLVWKFLYSHDIHLQKESETVITCGVIVVIGILYSIIASTALQSAWEDQKRMASAIQEYDRHKYLLCRDERVPMVIHLLLCSLSVLLIAMTMIIHYYEVSCGIVTVGSVSFITSLFFFVVQKVDEPRGSPWFKRSTPREWDEIDIDLYRTAMAKRMKDAEEKMDEIMKEQLKVHQ